MATGSAHRPAVTHRGAGGIAIGAGAVAVGGGAHIGRVMISEREPSFSAQLTHYIEAIIDLIWDYSSKSAGNPSTEIDKIRQNLFFYPEPNDLRHEELKADQALQLLQTLLPLILETRIHSQPQKLANRFRRIWTYGYIRANQISDLETMLIILRLISVDTNHLTELHRTLKQATTKLEIFQMDENQKDSILKVVDALENNAVFR